MERFEIRLVIRQRNWREGTKGVNNTICVSIVHGEQLGTWLAFCAGASKVFCFGFFFPGFDPRANKNTHWLFLS